MQHNRKNILTVLVFTDIKALSVLVLLIGLDYMTPKVAASSSAFPIKENDYRDLVLSPQEKNTLDLFKSRVTHRLPKPYMQTDFYLVRWIRVAKYNVEQAEKKLIENLKWREDNKMDQIVDEDFSSLFEDYVLSTNSHDKRSRPVGTLNLGTWDLRKANLEGKMPIVIRYTELFFELLVRHIFEAQQTGENVTRAVVLVDLEGFNLFQHACPACIRYQITCIVGAQAHYPMFWEAFLTINSPPIFNIVANTARGVLQEELKDTFKVFTHDKNKWMEYLDDRIDRDQRYTNYGGTKK